MERFEDRLELCGRNEVILIEDADVLKSLASPRDVGDVIELVGFTPPMLVGDFLSVEPYSEFRSGVVAVCLHLIDTFFSMLLLNLNDDIGLACRILVRTGAGTRLHLP